MAMRHLTDQVPPAAHTMGQLFDRCGVSLTRTQCDQLWTYHGLLRQHNQMLNLTRIHNFTNMVLKLYVDSVLPGQMLDLPSPLMDLGSGPGMPGIPLKILHPHLEIWLAESRARRIIFLREVVQALGLRGIHLIDSKITPHFTQPMAGVITRAVESMDQTLDRVKGCLQENGRVIFMKGPGCEAEIETARQVHGQGFKLIQDTAYNIGQTQNHRRLVIFQRLDRPPQARAADAARRHRTQVITSASNDQFKSLKKLLLSRGIKKAGQGLLSGSQPVVEMLNRFPERCLGWITRGNDHPPPSSAPRSLDWLQLAPDLFDQLDIFGTHGPLLAIQVPPLDRWHPHQGLPDGCSLLVPFQDPENIGAVIRSAAAFKVDQVILLSESAHPYHPKALRASGGLTPMVRLLQGPALTELPTDLPILALSADGKELAEVQFAGTFGLLAGTEGQGLPDPWRVNAVRIPIAAEVDSLNAAVSIGIVLYEWRRRRGNL
jgi:16S rRNA (guanine(527)-N(7))-methyltransferase RsmG